MTKGVKNHERSLIILKMWKPVARLKHIMKMMAAATDGM